MRSITLIARNSRLSQLLKRQLHPAFLRCADQIKIIIRRYAASGRPRMGSCVWDAERVSYVLDRRPDVFDVLHVAILRAVRIVGQYANCSVGFARLGCEIKNFAACIFFLLTLRTVRSYLPITASATKPSH